ncbi:MAG: TonB-dependent receptor [Tannerellaceae bacterium]|jgi:outer membrane receptor for ferrienterochelin and colicin|nr:TonB-dependent receptor [Tannerellaceae bacterium]
MSKTKSLLLFAFFYLSMSSFARNYTVSGYVRDQETKEVLIGCSIYEKDNKKGTSSNTYGFYSLTLPEGNHQINYSYLGYANTTVEFRLTKDTTIMMYLSLASNELDEVVVSSDRRLKGLRLGTIDVPELQIKRAPALLGETDLMKALQHISGVQQATEGKSDLSVRGGNPDQNLILLDGVPVYNTNHVFGFLSVFNTDAVKKVTFYKSNFPARFGGRLSSVIDITTKDGNKEKIIGSLSVGLPTLKLNLEGPIIKDRTSFTFSARKTYVDMIVAAINKQSAESGSRANFGFYDLNAKIHHKIDDRTYLYLSAYKGNDQLRQESFDIENKKTENNSSTEDWKWGNVILAGQISRVLTSELFFKGSLAYNRYHYKIDALDKYKDLDDPAAIWKDFRRFLFTSGIKDYSLSGDFEYFPSHNHNVKFGTSLTFHDFNPEVFTLSLNDENTARTTDDPPIYPRELVVFGEDEWDLLPQLRLNGGLRFSLFDVNGKAYTSVDPRLSLRYLLTDRLSLQTGYTLMRQYVHLLSSNSMVMQTDLWVPVTEKVKPMQSGQSSLGIFYELPQALFLSLEAYYKQMQNVLEYKDGVSYTGGWENKVEAGIGRSYGVELAVEKREGNITGVASYAWSKSTRKFEEINFGEWFPAKYDRRHAFNLLLTYRLNEKFDFTATWTYHSGDRITLPLMTFVNPDVPNTGGGQMSDLLELEHRNNYQMAAYHRLDLSANYTFAKKKNRHCVLNLGIYNAYNRMNPYRMIIETDVHRQSDGRFFNTYKLKQVTLFPLIPSFSFTYHFLK